MKWPMPENTENSDAAKPSARSRSGSGRRRRPASLCMIVYDDESTYEFDLCRERWPLPSRR